jgi:hypothetical protein
MNDFELELEMENLQIMLEEADENDKYKNMLPGDRLKAKMADWQAKRDSDLSTPAARLRAKVQSSQDTYNQFQKQASADPANVDKYRAEKGSADLATTNAQKGLSDAEKDAAIDQGMNKNTPHGGNSGSGGGCNRR